MNFKILVMGCDRYSKYTTELFNHCVEKYWANHPEIIYCNESVINPYYKTLTIDIPVHQWTKRLNQALKQIDSDIVLVCPEDTFFRKKVNDKVLKKLCTYIDDKLIAINLEPPFDCYNVNQILSIRNPNGKWLTSFMPQLWNKNKLMELLKDKSLNPREAERLGRGTPYSYGIIANYKDFDFGKIPNVYPYAIVEGKWAKEMIDFTKKEGIEIDFSELGFFERKA